jgi:hypothetical protein
MFEIEEDNVGLVNSGVLERRWNKKSHLVCIMNELKLGRWNLDSRGNDLMVTRKLLTDLVFKGVGSI